MAKNDFQYVWWNSYTLQCGTIIDFATWLQLAVWHVALEFIKWQHSAMWHVALESWHWICQVAASCSVADWQVALGWHAIEFVQTSAILEFYIWFRFWPTCHSAPVCEILSKSDHPQQKTSISAVAKRPRDASCLSLASLQCWKKYNAILYRFFRYLILNNIVTLKPGLEVTQDHSNW